MGWSIDLIPNKIVDEEEIDDIISKLPQELSFSLGNSKQPWGWSAGVDVTLRDDNTIWLSGSYGISGGIAEQFVAHMKSELESKGHLIKIADRR
ncbi:hypothetical protein [Paenibacillus polymyxa]|uniref:Uncharacterized protein n=1 Tax=Paenibacillus polymyxa TaxID=1406 RepID=A0ABX2ZDL7_PAEPO|nr:hypothetical protein [Paenibacillus polymyxa]ODA08280.1 hypothetical protein A7312_27830 [Paenibacillus polymyxa]